MATRVMGMHDQQSLDRRAMGMEMVIKPAFQDQATLPARISTR